MKNKTVKRVSDEIIIQRGWIEGLLKTAQRVVDTIDKVEVNTNTAIMAKSNIYGLLGYISSADTVLKYAPTYQIKAPRGKK